MSERSTANFTGSRRLYMDNAATSFPKPAAVTEAMTRFAAELGASPGRGSYRESVEAGRILEQCRRRINDLIHGENPDHVIFTLNCSDALNLAIKGICHPRMHDGPIHVVTSDLDHNSILRPCNALVADGVIEQTRVPIDAKTGLVDPEQVRAAMRPETKLVALLHASNVTGAMQDLAAIGAICREHDVPFLVDAAQSAGHYPLDVQQMGIDLLAAPGHKGMLGPLGTGFLYIRPGLEHRVHPLREGGTGSISENDTQPDFMPDRFEAGSHNTIGIAGLNEGVKYILDIGIDAIWSHEQALIKTMIESLTDWGDMPGFTLHGPGGVKNRCGVFSVSIDGVEPGELSAILESEYSILTRSGLHCAPGAHQAIDTTALGGATRLSFGPFLTTQDVKYAADALGQICHNIADTAAAAPAG